MLPRQNNTVVSLADFPHLHLLPVPLLQVCGLKTLISAQSADFSSETVLRVAGSSDPTFGLSCDYPPSTKRPDNALSPDFFEYLLYISIISAYTFRCLILVSHTSLLKSLSSRVLFSSGNVSNLLISLYTKVRV